MRIRHEMVRLDVKQLKRAAHGRTAAEIARGAQLSALMVFRAMAGTHVQQAKAEQLCRYLKVNFKKARLDRIAA